MVEGLYSGLGTSAALNTTQLDVKMKLLVEAPAAVEDALASLLDHHDHALQVTTTNQNNIYPDELCSLVWSIRMAVDLLRCLKFLAAHRWEGSWKLMTSKVFEACLGAQKN